MPRSAPLVTLAMSICVCLFLNGSNALGQGAPPANNSYFDPRVQPTTHVQPAPVPLPDQVPQLMPAAAPVVNQAPGELTLSPRGDKPAPLLPKRESGSTVKRDGTGASWLSLFASLGVVLGLFLTLTWFVKRGMPAQAQKLPNEVVEVLGVTTLAARQTAQLIRVGNKLLFVSFAPGGAETLTEITDPLEVDRLAGLCHAQQAQSTSASFRSLIEQFSREKPSTAEIRTAKNLDRARNSTNRPSLGNHFSHEEVEDA